MAEVLLDIEGIFLIANAFTAFWVLGPSVWTDITRRRACGVQAMPGTGEQG